MKARDESKYPPHCQRMRRALASKNWQQVVLVMVMDQSASTVNRILTGAQKMTAKDALDYGFVLGLSPETLLREQDEWLLTMLPPMENKLAAIRRRAATVTARVAGDAQAEIASLKRERDAIDERIAILTKRFSSESERASLD